MKADAESLVLAAEAASKSAAARTFGMAAALRLLVKWVLRVEARLEILEGKQ